MTSSKPTLYLLDASSYFFRAYHSNIRLTRSDGFPTNAVYVFTRMLVSLIKEQGPTHLIAVFDVKGGTFRNELYPEYKANRPPVPEDLKKQFEPVQEVLASMRVPTAMRPGFEADDLIATYARLAREAGHDVVIVSGDKDLAQLVDERTVMLDTMKGVTYDREAVREKWGVWPEQMRDLLALMGDSSDNIPGVRGVGPKTARKLLMDFGSIERLEQALPELKNPKLKARLEAGWEALKLSRELVTLKDEVPLEGGLDDARLQPPDPAELARVFGRYEFGSLLDPLGLQLQGALDFGAPAAEVAAAAGEAEYRCLDTLEALDAALEELRAAGVAALDVETDSLDVRTARLVGVALSCRVGRGWYVPLAHRDAERQLAWEDVRPRLAALLSDPELLRVGHNLKFDRAVFAAHDLDVGAPCFDTMVASYLLAPDRNRHGLDACAQSWLGRTTTPFSEVAPDEMFDRVDVATATRYSGEDAEVAVHLHEHLAPRLDEAGLTALMREIEMPLVAVLGDMEGAGVRIDREVLAVLSRELIRGLQRLETEIYQTAGIAFNINSPKQLGDVLFNRLKLPVIKKTKRGPSTNVTVLEELAHRHPLPAKVLEFRHLTKLQGTYVEVLPTLIHPGTGRIHTSYNQTVAATGRLSSSDPNLQNIPIRTDLGRRIREAFVPEDGCVFLGADYSQIELRVLAHLADDPKLIQAFIDGEDIHRRTAAELFGLAPDEVTRELRGRAKTINFGVLYGMSAFRLSNELGIPRKEADAFIARYFSRYPGIQRFIDRTLEEARETGAVTTLLGRRRLVPGVASGRRQEEQAAQRVAINTPVQGTAADIIKIAMIDIHRELARRGLSARMVLQVHDELMLELPEAELDEVRALVIDKMENALTLKVPLRVDHGVGRTWNEAHQ